MPRKPAAVATPAPSIPLPESDGRTNLIAFERARRYLDVSRSTLLRYIYSRKLNAIKMDGGWRFHWSDIDRFVQRRTQKAA